MDSQGDLHEDFGAFYRAQLQVVLGFCFSRTQDRERAADLAAEVFAAALVARRGYSPELGSVRQWLLGIAAHKVADAERRGCVERRAQEQLGMPEIQWTDGDLDRVVVAADDELVEQLDGLPANQQSAVRARVLDERSYVEIARESGVSEATVRQRVSRGLATIRRRASKERNDEWV